MKKTIDTYDIRPNKRGKEPDMGCLVHLSTGGDHKKEAQCPVFALHFSTDSRGQSV